jgi:predicted nucleic acid-binding protein
MILVDTSVWIDYGRGALTSQTAFLRGVLPFGQVAMGDIILAEWLQGVRSDAAATALIAGFSQIPCIDIGGRDCAIAAAQNYRKLRALGVTPRKTIDVLIATRCILDSHALLHADKDFDPFEAHLGLKVIHAP